MGASGRDLRRAVPEPAQIISALQALKAKAERLKLLKF